MASPLTSSCRYQPVREKIFHTVQGLWPFSYFHIFCLDLASVKENSHLQSSLARFCRYLSVCQTSSKYYQRVKRCGHFFSLTDNGRTDSIARSAFQSVEAVDFSAGRAVIHFLNPWGVCGTIIYSNKAR